MSEFEIHTARLYVRKGGWRITILDIINFDTGNSWSLLAFAWDKQEGFSIAVSSC